MSENILKIEVVIIELEKARNLLGCYDELITDHEECNVGCYASLYESAWDILDKRIKKLENIFNALHAGIKEVSR